MKCDAQRTTPAPSAIKQLLQQVITVVNQSEDVTLGWSVDRTARAADLDFELTARSGTPLAEQLAAMKPGKTNFAGFALPEAAATANWAGTLTDAQVAQTKSTLAALRKALVHQLENQGLSEDGLKQATHLADELFAVLEKSVETRRSDGGLAVLVDPAGVTVLGGAAVADGGKLDEIFKELVAEIEKGSPVSGRLDQARCRDLPRRTLPHFCRADSEPSGRRWWASGSTWSWASATTSCWWPPDATRPRRSRR